MNKVRQLRSFWALGLIFVLALASCGKNKAEARRLGALCVQAIDMLANESQGVDDDTFRLMLKNGLTACSGGCDEGDAPSCEKLEGQLKIMCNTSPGMCQSFCAEGEKGTSLQTTACKVAKSVKGG